MLDPQLREPRRDQEQGRGSWDQKAGLPSASVSQQLCKGRTSPDTEQSTFLYELLRSRNNYQMKRCGLGRTEPRAQLHLSPGSACSLALTYVFGPPPPPHPPTRPPPAPVKSVPVERSEVGRAVYQSITEQPSSSDWPDGPMTTRSSIGPLTQSTDSE